MAENNVLKKYFTKVKKNATSEKKKLTFYFHIKTHQTHFKKSFSIAI
jgi:hypothetical protein